MFGLCKVVWVIFSSIAFTSKLIDANFEDSVYPDVLSSCYQEYMLAVFRSVSL